MKPLRSCESEVRRRRGVKGRVILLNAEGSHECAKARPHLRRVVGAVAGVRRARVEVVGAAPLDLHWRWRCFLEPLVLVAIALRAHWREQPRRHRGPLAWREAGALERRVKVALRVIERRFHLLRAHITSRLVGRAPELRDAPFVSRAVRPVRTVLTNRGPLTLTLGRRLT
jgi:hypothetical protein|eukprot:4436322-Prymnesium_polylepis.1